MSKINLRSYDPATRYITEESLRLFKEDDRIEISELIHHLLACPDLPMHCPQHHYLVTAAMLSVAFKAQGRSQEELSDALLEAMMRAKNVLPAFCGLYGSCGTAVGLGIYASILQDCDQYSEKSWALSNKIVGECLSKISQIEGPRCCKRNTYLALEVGLAFSKEHFQLNLGDSSKIVCRHYMRNVQDCKKSACPFYPVNI